MVATILNSLMLLVFIAGAAGPGVFELNRPFDEFGDIKCEDEMAHLDNFAVQLQNDPSARGAIVFFAGKMAADKLPKRGEAEARVERVKSYLTKQRGIPAARIVVLNGGYDSNFRVQLWAVPSGAGLPKPEASSPVKDMQYRKGKLVPTDYRCGI
jgi:hypothetical protein